MQMLAHTIAVGADRGGLTNRWSSRLRGWSELSVQTRKEPRPRGVVGGAAQLYVMTPWPCLEAHLGELQGKSVRIHNGAA